ncbi:hypothetical protein JCM3766R1_005705 [Sporobolomyces carnicolor]
MASRLAFADIAHRVTVSGLFGLSVYGLYGIWRTHTETMKAGEIAWAKHQQELQLKEKEQQDPLLKGFVDPPAQRPS